MPKVGGTKEGRRETVPLRIVPEGGQVPEYLVESPAKESWHVLHEHVRRSKMAKAACKLRPKPAGILLPKLPARLRDRLARESTANKVRSSDSIPVDLLDVSEVRHTGEILGQNAGRIGLGLGLPDDTESGPFQAETEPSNPSEQFANG